MANRVDKVLKAIQATGLDDKVNILHFDDYSGRAGKNQEAWKTALDADPEVAERYSLTYCGTIEYRVDHIASIQRTVANGPADLYVINTHTTKSYNSYQLAIDDILAAHLGSDVAPRILLIGDESNVERARSHITETIATFNDDGLQNIPDAIVSYIVSDNGVARRMAATGAAVEKRAATSTGLQEDFTPLLGAIKAAYAAKKTYVAAPAQMPVPAGTGKTS
ncbi:TPA: hypothetical protein HA246_05900 [Candidatus Woesearchaeota archaeon]|nr:hypothetical protein [Candidatus Woesearchaeota archaeon]